MRYIALGCLALFLAAGTAKADDDGLEVSIPSEARDMQRA